LSGAALELTNDDGLKWLMILVRIGSAVLLGLSSDPLDPGRKMRYK
jgi:hypothetical protein